MAGQNMPAAEVEISVELVRRLLSEQRPELVDRPLDPIAFGWDNVSFRIGTDLVVRLPRRELAAALIENEARWLPDLAQYLPLPVPVPLFVGDPGEGYPWHWLIAPLLPGVPASTAMRIEYEVCAIQLAEFLVALHHPAPEEAPVNPFRGGPLSDRDTSTRERLEDLEEIVDIDRLVDLWDRALEAPGHASEPVWLHGDPHPGNLLISAGALSGVIDFGDISRGDPATDLALVWSFLPLSQRDTFWESYGDSDPYLRERARGWALSLGAVLLAHSADNPTMRAIGERTLRAVLDQA